MASGLPRMCHKDIPLGVLAPASQNQSASRILAHPLPALCQCQPLSCWIEKTGWAQEKIQEGREAQPWCSSLNQQWGNVVVQCYPHIQGPDSFQIHLGLNPLLSKPSCLFSDQEPNEIE